MTLASTCPVVFIGSSSEGRLVARNLESELADVCTVVRWDRGVFEPSGYALDSLLKVAAAADFAVLVATPDDTTLSRGTEMLAARDNIVLEFGLFAGALGRDRTYLLATDYTMKLPTDVLGLTRLPYRPHPHDLDQRAPLNDAVLQIEERVRALGRRQTGSGPSERLGNALDREVAMLCANAVAQGWTVKTNSATTLRLRSPRGRLFSLVKGQPETTRDELRWFARQLRAAGLRVNGSVWRPVADSPF